MPMPGEQAETKVEKSLVHYAKQWGESSLPPTLLATLITAQHARPFQALPMLFPPVLLFSTYMNLSGYNIDSAGVTAAWSFAYLVIAARRKQPFARKFGARGILRGGTLGLCLGNTVGGGLAYGFGRRQKEDERRPNGI